jgi:hypothetical protein
MAKFRHFEESRIQLGVGEVHIQEVSDGVHLTISEEIEHSIRLGIPNEHGTTYNYWRDIVNILKDDEDSIKLASAIVELEDSDLNQEELPKPLRPEFVNFSDNNIDWIGIKLLTSNGDPILVCWEKGSGIPIPTISFNLDWIKKATKIGQSVFYQELAKVCSKVLDEV